MDRLDAMTVFAAIVDAGSLSAAGRRLDIPLTTISRKLSDLEAYLKTQLVARSTRKLALTDAGRDYLAACRDILKQVDEAELTASGTFAKVSGRLVITAPIVFGRLHVVPVVTAFLEQYPDVDVRLLLSDGVINLLDEQVDIALRIGALSDSSYIAKALGTVERVTCASPGYLAAFGIPSEPSQLSEHLCVTFEGLMSPSAWVFAGPKAPIRVRVRSRLSVTTSEAAIAAALASVGVTRVLSYQVMPLLKQGLLVRLLAAYEPPPIPVNLIYLGQSRLAMKTRAFLDLAAIQLRAQLLATKIALENSTDEVLALIEY